MPPDDITQPGAANPSTSTTVPQAGTATTPPQTTPPPTNSTSTDPVTGEPDIDKLEGNTKAYIQNLRKENAKYRTEAKSAKEKLESVGKALGVRADETPEQQALRLNAEREQVAFENAVLSNAIDHGIAKDDMEFFEFKIVKARNGLKEGEELSAEAIGEIAKLTKARGVKPPATTTVTHSNPGGGATAAPPPVGQTETLTVEKFATLGFNEKCRLFESNPALYTSMMASATQKRLIK